MSDLEGCVRRVRSDEIERWCACPLRPDEPGYAAWVEGERAWVRRRHDPAEELFAFDHDGEFLGKYDIPIRTEAGWTLYAPSVVAGPRAAPVMRALCAHVVGEARRRRSPALEVILEGGHPAFELASGALLDTGLRVDEDKVLFGRELEQLPPSDDDSWLDFRPASELTEDELSDLRAASGVPDGTSAELTMTRQARSSWLVAIADGRPVGLALPWSAPGDTPLSLLHVGVAPTARGKGVGRALLLELLRQARSAGTTSYVGSTTSDNAAMIRLFETIGCEQVGRRTIFVL